ncbi:hypothetical protein [Dysgonomonas sp. HGC4]|uniref:hypothetical protein n=1 Tax=Dysgonomonas sp. HGC4 TaxID=1658009 RepID=UPI000681944D|nr:hypothetical protein [Dysgonomonas sp. HGC4]MBD8348595.1 hypothetical protein [Dysgonomonas sp. HGC4]
MKVFVRIYQKPLKIKVYSSLIALIEDSNLDDLGASKSKLEKHPFNDFDYVTHKVIISKKETISTGDVRRSLQLQSDLPPNKTNL